MPLDQCRALRARYHRVLEKAARVPHARRVRQLAPPDRDHRVEDIARPRLLDVPLAQLVFDIGVAHHGCPLTRQRESHVDDQARLGFMLEGAVAIAEPAFISGQRLQRLSRKIPRLQAMKPLGKLDAVGADILDRRRAHRARNQRQVFQARHAVVEQPLDQRMPVLACADLHPPAHAVVGPLHAGDFDLQYAAVEVLREKHIAAATQHQQRHPEDTTVGQHTL